VQQIGWNTAAQTGHAAALASQYEAMSPPLLQLKKVNKMN